MKTSHGHARISTLASVLISALAMVPSGASGDEFPLAQWDTWRQRSSNRYPQERWQQYATPEEAGWSDSSGLRVGSGGIVRRVIVVKRSTTKVETWSRVELNGTYAPSFFDRS